jgi:hypothetical protein
MARRSMFIHLAAGSCLLSAVIIALVCTCTIVTSALDQCVCVGLFLMFFLCVWRVHSSSVVRYSALTFNLLN